MWVPFTESGIGKEYYLQLTQIRDAFCFILVIHNWKSTIPNSLSLEIGDPIDIIEEAENWFRGSTRRSKDYGIFPKNIIQFKTNIKHDIVIIECTEILREWFDIWKRLFKVSCHTFSY